MSIKKYIAEFLGAFLLTFAVYVSLAAGMPLPTPLVAGLALGLVVYLVGSVSGAHANPAITLGALSVGKIKVADAVGYIIFQIVGAWLAGNLLHLDLRFTQREAGLHVLPGIDVGIDVVLDPAIEPGFDVAGFHEAADLVARHHLQVMGEPARRHDVGKARRD